MTESTKVIAPVACRVCDGCVAEFLELGRQPLSDRFLTRDDLADEFFYRLAVGQCSSCGMVQLAEEVPRHLMFHEAYPYRSSGSSVMREHFGRLGRDFLDKELAGPDPFIVEIGCNDGIMLKAIQDAGVRHVGFEPSMDVARVAQAKGVRVRTDFFEEATAEAVCAEEGMANVIYAANTLSHIPYLESVFRGVDALLAPDGTFVFEDPYFGDIVAKTSFDQISDEHFFLFSAGSIQATAERYGFELVNVQRLPVHGGEVRYTLARHGARTPTTAVARLLADERDQMLTDLVTLRAFATNVARTRDDLMTLLNRLHAQGRRVVGYGATAKSATVTNFCGIGPELVQYVCDTTQAKQNRLTPGMHIPVRPPLAFTDPYPDYALLFAWNHAEEIMAKEQGFQQAGGRWILYVPGVHVI